MSLPGYDAWLTRDPRDRDYAPCECGHDYDDHQDAQVTIGDDEYGYDSYGSLVCTVLPCQCNEYREQGPPERDPDEAWDRRHE